MDNIKRIILATVCAMIVLIGWQFWYSYYLAHHPEFQQQAQTASSAPATTQSAAAAVAATQGAAGVASTGPATSSSGGSTIAAASGLAAPATQELQARAGPPTSAPIGSDKPDYSAEKTSPYALGINLTSKGASVALVTVNEFRADVGKPAPFTFQEPYPDPDDRGRALATRALIIDGQRIDVQDLDWNQTDHTDASITYTLPILDSAGKPLLDVSKTYTLTTRKDPGSGYEMTVSYSMQSRVSRTLKVQLIFDGPNSMTPVNYRDYVQAVGAYKQGDSIRVNPYAVASIKSGATQDLTAPANEPMLWAGTSNTYFNALLRMARETKENGKTALTVEPLKSVTAEGLQPEQGSTPPDQTPPPRAAIAFETPALPVAAAAPTRFEMIAFFGPKERGLLNNSYYSAFPRDYGQTLVLVNRSGYFGWVCGLCTFQWLVNVLVDLLWGIHFVVRDWGLAIIVLVLIVRVLLHPITKKSQVSMMHMQKMGPEIERLKKKYGDNKEELNKAMMGVYKEQGIAPLLGCAPMFLQMPIWIALWNALQSTFELWHAPFLWGYTWIKDLSAPDALYTFAHPIALPFGWHLHSINLLPLLMVVVTWMNQKYMPKPAVTTPDQAKQQKMMQGMSMLFPLMFYPFPSGLNLYYVTSMGLGIFESKRIRAHIEEKERLEKEQRVLVDAKPTRASRRIAKDAREEAKETRRGRFATWLANLQRKADEVRKDAERKNKRK